VSDPGPPTARRLLLTVESTFLLEGYGLVVAPGPRFGEVEPGVVEVELRRPDGTVVRATLSLEYDFPVPTPPVRHWTPVFRSLGKDDVPVGTEVWIAGR
jgi:hypothetical protein